MTDKKTKGSIYKFIAPAKDRLELEIIVLDKDEKSAIDFIKKHLVSVTAVTYNSVISSLYIH